MTTAKYFMVVGRHDGWDENVAYPYYAESKEDAVGQFRREIVWAATSKYPEDLFPQSDWIYECKNGDTHLSYEEWLDHRVESEYGERIYVNHVLKSDSPID